MNHWHLGCGELLRLIAVAAMISVGAARAQTLDQNYDPGAVGFNLSAGIGSINTKQELAQTFTVELTGDLTRVDIYIRRFSGTIGNMFVDLRSVDGLGYPVDGNLRSVTIPGIDVPTFPNPVAFFTVDFTASPLPVRRDNHLGIVLHCDGGDLTMQWIGSNINDPYPGGGAGGRLVGRDGWDMGHYDLGFRTFVIVPEASSMGLMLLGLLISIHPRRPTTSLWAIQSVSGSSWRTVGQVKNPARHSPSRSVIDTAPAPGQIRRIFRNLTFGVADALSPRGSRMYSDNAVAEMSRLRKKVILSCGWQGR